MLGSESVWKTNVIGEVIEWLRYNLYIIWKDDNGYKTRMFFTGVRLIITVTIW